MNRTRHCGGFFAAVLAAAAIFGGTPVYSAGPVEELSHAFRVTLTSSLNSEILGKKQPMDTTAQFLYTWQGRQMERDLTINGFSVKAKGEGVPAMNLSISLTRLVDIRNGVTNEITFENAPGPLKTKMKDSYGAPICRLKLDEQGREVSREITARPGAMDLVNNGSIANAMLFHPPFLQGKDQWQNETQVSMGNGGYAKGELTYKMKSSSPSGLVFAVSGMLTNANFKQTNSPVTIKTVRYVVSGEQTYDLARHDWASGKLEMDVMMQMEADGKRVGVGNGTIVADFEMLPQKH